MTLRSFYKIAILPTVLLTILLIFSCASSSKAIVQYDYLTPQMFGAIGDGKKDDTNALRLALKESSSSGKVLYFPSGCIYRVTGTLNLVDNKYIDLKLNMLGCAPIKNGSYVPKESGGIKVEDGVKLFKNAVIRGSIERTCITGKRDLNVRFFDNCECNGLVITGCNISNFGSLFYDTPLSQISDISHNTFLTVYYFSKNENSSSGMTDATISFNYINGGAELNDNSCFEWAYYNGAIISNNFIDYYRTIYSPKAVTKQAFVGPLSYSNQYQVFRYFFYPGNENIASLTFTSSSDAFNWNDPQKLDKLNNFLPITYKGKDGKKYDIPPYVAQCNATWMVTISDAKIENNMGPLVFVNSSLTEYEGNRFEVSFVGNNPYKQGQILYRQGDLKPFYNNGEYRDNSMVISGIIEVLDALPSSAIGWSSSVQGRTVKVKDKTYRATNRKVGNAWKSEWREVSHE